MYLTRKKLIGKRDAIDDMTKESGRLWSDIVRRFWQTVRRQNHWLSRKAVQRWLCKSDRVEGLYSQSAQAVADQFFEALNSWRKRKDDDPDANPPKSQKTYNKVVFKKRSFEVRDGVLYLKRGRGIEPVAFEWEHGEPVRVEMGYNDQHSEYELRVQYEVEPDDCTTGDKTAGIDLGEKHIAAAYVEGERPLLFNGGELRSKRRYQNKIKAKLDSEIDTKEYGSNRFWKLVQSKNDQLGDIRNQIRDILHKTSRRLVEMLLERGVSTLAVGDVRDIRGDIDYGSKANQRLHQWVHGTFRRMVAYKAELAGMDVKLVDESYTSRDCPLCGNRKGSAPSGREYACAECEFEGHRDVVGAFNILRKYHGGSRVVGVMASPLGVRYDPDASCSSSSQRKTSPEAVA